MTYDRKINKMGIENVYRANNNIIPPSITSPLRIFTENFTVELKNTREGGKIYYTTDGTEPTEESTLYTEPFTISETSEIRAFTKWDDKRSRSTTYLIEKKDIIAATENVKPKPGIRASVYEGSFNVLPDFSAMKPSASKTVNSVSHIAASKDSMFAIVFEGYINVPADGVYGLYVNSDDGSKLVIGDTEPVINDGIHGMTEEGRSFPLAKGFHKLRIEYFQGTGGIGLEFLMETAGQPKTAVPSNWLFN
jgi:hypothetical protein